MRQPRTAERDGDASPPPRPACPVSLAAPGPVSQDGLGRAGWPGPCARARPLGRSGCSPMAAVRVLAVQAALSLRLVWSNTAFQDEGLYLWSGQSGLPMPCRGTPIPAFATYFPACRRSPTNRLCAAARQHRGLAGAAAEPGVHADRNHPAARRDATGSSPAARRRSSAALFAGARLGSVPRRVRPPTTLMALMLLALATWFRVRAAFCQTPARR